MENLSQFLTATRVKLDDLLLDPNNPRFAELGEELDQVPEGRFAEAKVQNATIEKMKASRFNVIELRNTIKELGFLPMDRLVVRKWRGSEESEKYVVVEGNRRVTALKWLIELHETGRETIPESELGKYQDLEVLLLDDARAPETARWILPGLRHVSGIKEWGPYQKARTVFELRETGKSPQEVAQSLGLSTKAANQLWRAYHALEQMRADEEYGELADPRLYSYFEEVFKRPNVKEWLGWSDDQQKFTATGELREFYSWIKGEPDEEDESFEPKLPESKSVRDLSKIIDDPKAFAVFRSAEGTLMHALARAEADQQVDFAPTILNCESVLASLSPDTLRNMPDSSLEGLQALQRRIEVLLDDRRKLLDETSGTSG